jgi:hypothetical protein
MVSRKASIVRKAILGDQGCAENRQNGAGPTGAEGNQFHDRHACGDDDAKNRYGINAAAPNENLQARPQPAIDKTGRRSQPFEGPVEFLPRYRPLQQPLRQPEVVSPDEQLNPD